MRLHKSAAVLGLLSACLAQTASKVVEPEALGIIFNVDPASQELKRLPSEAWYKHESRGFPAKITNQIRIDGPASAFRLAGGDKATFVFAGVGEQDLKIKIFALEVNGSRREYVVGQYRGRDYTANPGVTAALARYGSSSYKLTPDQPLKPGEYAIAFGPSLFTFGVDAAPK